MIRQPDDASLAQIRAADPSASTWVTANAGSGKTRVLTDRVARLLLAKCDPSKILCLTYTKAAAAEMQNRLFQRLGAWAMMPDDALTATLAELQGTEVQFTTVDLANARRLFAAALETPGGLKIQTIHAFCDAVLRRFPAEAGISPQFETLDERSAKLLRTQVLEELAQDDPGAIGLLARHFTGADPDGIVAEIAAHKSGFGIPVDPAVFGISGEEDLQIICDNILTPERLNMIADCANALSAGNSRETGLANKMARLLDQVDPDKRLLLAEDIFLLGEGAKTPFAAKGAGIISKSAYGRFPQLVAYQDELDSLAEETETLRDHHLSITAFERSRDLHAFAAAYLPRYQTAKTARGLLEFDDLVALTERLLTQADMAAWVLYRLDGGIDHILVDEAQDTNPGQWAVIKALADEFTTGASARDVVRTLFVVGDRKQSIYSFQGADPAIFDEMRHGFAQAQKAIGGALELATLAHSFRTASPILGLVDAVWEQDNAQEPHLAFHSDKPGRIELWPYLEKTPQEDLPWHVPRNARSDEDVRIQLAEQIADWIAELLRSGHLISGKSGHTRPVRAGDFLILVQRRGGLFQALIKALKSADLPIAGADRMRVGQELAVRDLVSLLRVGLTPEDDLALAEALRSPLLGLSEQDVFALSHGRGDQFLWQRLRDRAETYPEAYAIVSDIMNRADFERPFELIDRILSLHDGRSRIEARLGAEALDAVDEFLALALEYEQSEAPSLTGFLTWFAQSEGEVKRVADGDADQIRVMTVHGSKGLEAPICILPDTGPRTGNPNQKELARLSNGTIVWKPKSAQQPAVIAEVVKAEKLLKEAENNRLLYVAMTRAESWLVIAGAGEKMGKLPCWYSKAEEAISKLSPRQEGDRLVVANAEWNRLSADSAGAAPKGIKRPLDDWALTPAAQMPRPPQPVSPSSLPGAKALSGEDGDDTDAAMARGTAVHALLEHLPIHSRGDWPGLAPHFAPNDTDDALAEATLVLTDTALQFIFAPNTLAEVAVTGKISDTGEDMFGIIDRLIVSDADVHAIDFKTNRVIPSRTEDIPLGVLRQLDAYGDALSQIYSGRTIKLSVLWTYNATLVTLLHEDVKSLLQSAAIS